ncbi:MAG TPA: hypothetical protein EYH40_01920 [Desulfurococcales archaeon]|nr:hypothetical protein [Desulfurococcales archaeon]
MISGITLLDDTLGDIRKGLLVIYGDAASGKTTLSLQYLLSVLESGGKVLFISTENELFIDRLSSMVSDSRLLEKVDLLIVRDYNVQNLIILSMLIKPNVVNMYDLIVVDSLTALYRLASYDDRKAINKLNMQLAILSKLSSAIPVIVTSQVRGEEEGFDILASSLVRYWADYIIKLEIIDRGLRKLTIEKPEEKFKVLELIITKGGLKCYHSSQK